MGMTDWTPNASAPLWYEGAQGEPHGPFFEAKSLSCHYDRAGVVLIHSQYSLYQARVGMLRR